MDGNSQLTSQDKLPENSSDNTSTNVRTWPSVRPGFSFRSEGERAFGANLKFESNKPELPQETAPPIIPQEPLAQRDSQPNDKVDGRPDPTGEPSKKTAGPLPRVTAAVVRIEDRASRLAAALNHPEVTLDDYLIAMTFENEGSEAFEERKLDLRKTCLANLVGQQSVAEAGARGLFSQDVQLLKSAAAEAAQKREGELQFVSVRDLSEALPKELFGSPQAHLTMQALAFRLDRVALIIEQMQRKIDEAGVFTRTQLDQSTRWVEETGQFVRAQLNQQSARLEMLARELVPTERAANDNSRLRWGVSGRVTMVAALAVFSLGAAAFTYFFR